MMKYLILLILISGCVSTKKPIITVVKINLVEHVYHEDTIIQLDIENYIALLRCDSIRKAQVNPVRINPKIVTPKVIRITDTLYRDGTFQKTVKIIKIKITKSYYKNYWWKYPLIVWSIFTSILVFGAYVYVSKKQLS